MLAGCSDGMEQIDLDDSDAPPSQTIRDAHIIRSEKGELQLEMTAPIIMKYTKPEAKTVYPDGVRITFFDEDKKPKAFFTAQKAVSFDNENRLEARDSVVIIDYRSNDTTYLADIIWDSRAKRIYREHPLRSVNGKKVTYGDSFESDDHFEHPQIMHQRGTIEWNEGN
jgi:hypothetical protein